VHPYAEKGIVEDDVRIYDLRKVDEGVRLDQGLAGFAWAVRRGEGIQITAKGSSLSFEFGISMREKSDLGVGAGRGVCTFFGEM